MTSVRTETLRLVSGRRVEGTTPSVAVLHPPLRRARGREEIAFLLLLDLEEEAPSHLQRRIREVTAQAFWSSVGSVTAALRRAVAAGNRALFHANLRARPEDRRYGGLACAALRKEEVFLAQAGPTWACALCGGFLEQFPREELPRLGSASYVEIRLAYLTPQPGDTLLVGSPRLGRSASDAVFRRILSREDVDALLAGLEQLGAREDFSALVACWPAPAVSEEIEPIPPEPVRTEPVTPTTLVEEPPPREERARKRPLERKRPRRPPAEVLRRLGQKLTGLAAAVAGGLLILGRGVRKLTITASEGLRALFRRMLPGRERRARRRPRRERRSLPPENPRTMAGLALAILLVVTLATILAWVTYSDTLRQDQALSLARQHADQAQQASDAETGRAYWEVVLADLEVVEDTAEAASLRAQAQAALDTLNGVVWVEPTLLHDFGTQLRPRRLIAHGQSLFVLDTASGSVLHLTLTGAGDQVDTLTTLVQTGHDVGRLVDMTWAGPGSARTADALVVLEEDEALIVYDPAWHAPGQGPNRIYLGGLPGQASPVAASAYEGKLYLLDPQTSQVWRYLPEGGGYPNRPEPYFATTAPYPLDAAQDLVIDGNVYILFDDGSVEKYFGGEPAPFEISGLPGIAPSFVALAVNSGWADGPLILADGADERVVVVTADGTFSAQFRTQGGAFQSLQTLTVDEATGRLFVLAGGRLYTLPLETVP